MLRGILVKNGTLVTNGLAESFLTLSSNISAESLFLLLYIKAQPQNTPLNHEAKTIKCQEADFSGSEGRWLILREAFQANVLHEIQT